MFARIDDTVDIVVAHIMRLIMFCMLVSLCGIIAALMGDRMIGVVVFIAILALADSVED